MFCDYLIGKPFNRSKTAIQLTGFQATKFTSTEGTCNLLILFQMSWKNLTVANALSRATVSSLAPEDTQFNSPVDAYVVGTASY